MPIYQYECGTCEGQFEAYVALTSSENPPCEKEGCGGQTERIWKISKHTPASVFPFVTKNLNGQPIEVRSAAHLEELCKIHGKTHRPDAAWIDTEYLGYDRKTKRQVYKEGRGVGLPGCWV